MVLLPTHVKDKRALELEDVYPHAGQGEDDADTIMEACEHSSNNRQRVELRGRKYLAGKTVDFNRDSVRFDGVAAGNRLDATYNVGTALVSTMTEGVAFKFSGRRAHYSSMTIASKADWAIESSLVQMSSLSDIHLDITKGNGVRVFDTFATRYERIDVWNRAKTKVGQGLWHDTTTEISGGFCVFEDVWASYFEYGVEFGQEDEHSGNLRRTNRADGIQGRHCKIGVRFGQGYAHTDVGVIWGEHNEVADLQLHSGTGEFSIRKLNTGSIGPSKPVGVLLGKEGDTQPVGPLKVHGGTMRRSGSAIKTVAPVTHRHSFDSITFKNNGPTLVGEGVDITRSQDISGNAVER